jgi:transposase
VEAVSQTVGISVTTLERWRAEVLANPSGNEVRHWTPAARLEAVIATAAMNQSARSGWCREHGVYPTELETWKQDAIGGLGEPRETESVAVKQDRRRRRSASGPASANCISRASAISPARIRSATCVTTPAKRS